MRLDSTPKETYYNLIPIPNTLIANFQRWGLSIDGFTDLITLLDTYDRGELSQLLEQLSPLNISITGQTQSSITRTLGRLSDLRKSGKTLPISKVGRSIVKSAGHKVMLLMGTYPDGTDTTLPVINHELAAFLMAASSNSQGYLPGITLPQESLAMLSDVAKAELDLITQLFDLPIRVLSFAEIAAGNGINLHNAGTEMLKVIGRGYEHGRSLILSRKNLTEILQTVVPNQTRFTIEELNTILISVLGSLSHARSMLMYRENYYSYIRLFIGNGIGEKNKIFLYKAANYDHDTWLSASRQNWFSKYKAIQWLPPFEISGEGDILFEDLLSGAVRLELVKDRFVARETPTIQSEESLARNYYGIDSSLLTGIDPALLDDLLAFDYSTERVVRDLESMKTLNKKQMFTKSSLPLELDALLANIHAIPIQLLAKKQRATIYCSQSFPDRGEKEHLHLRDKIVKTVVNKDDGKVDPAVNVALAVKIAIELAQQSNILELLQNTDSSIDSIADETIMDAIDSLIQTLPDFDVEAMRLGLKEFYQESILAMLLDAKVVENEEQLGSFLTLMAKIHAYCSLKMTFAPPRKGQDPVAILVYAPLTTGEDSTGYDLSTLPYLVSAYVDMMAYLPSRIPERKKVDYGSLVNEFNSLYVRLIKKRLNKELQQQLLESQTFIDSNLDVNKVHANILEALEQGEVIELYKFLDEDFLQDWQAVILQIQLMHDILLHYHENPGMLNKIEVSGEPSSPGGFVRAWFIRHLMISKLQKVASKRRLNLSNWQY